MNDRIRKRGDFMIYDDVFSIPDSIEGCSCPYCGNLTDSSDPDILCPECREDFGHTFYSEL